MSRRRKPQQMSVEDAMEAVRWRAQVLVEMADALKQPIQMQEPIKRMKEALQDYAANKKPLLNFHRCNECDGPCTTITDGLCNRCYDAHPQNVLTFAEMQS